MDRYAKSLRAALEEVRPDFSINEVRLSARSRPRTRLGVYARRYSAASAHAWRSSFAVNHVLDHAYAHFAFVLDPRRTVVTCHDIFPVKHWHGEIPELPRRHVPPLTVRLSLTGLRRARTIITSSQATKADLIRVLGISGAKIYVIPYGVDPSFRPVNTDPMRFGLDIGAQVILSLGSGAPYKNRGGILRTFARVAAQSTADVVLARTGTSLTGRDRAFIRQCGLSERVIELGFVPEEELPALYCSSHVLLFPSFYEGFGWPPLEAMACGVPVVTSTWDSLLEVVGDSALSAPATDYDALAGHVLRLLEDDCMRAEIIRRGIERARGFRWQQNAEETASLYDAVLSR
jgi:glycosyltransferase involved in cell wall biosynthesis